MAMREARRLDRLLQHRREEEERALAEEAAALHQVQAVRQRVHALEGQLHTGGESAQALLRWTELRDEQLWALKLHERAQNQRALLRRCEARLAEARAAVAEAGRRRLVVERLSDTARQRRRRRDEAAAQRELDESARLRALLREG